MTTTSARPPLIGLGASGLHAARHTLMQAVGDDAPARLREIGVAASEGVYARFVQWLPGYAGVHDPGQLAAAALPEVLSAFFQEIGWGTVELEQLGETGLAITSESWVEAEPSLQAASPSCFVSAGLLADFLTRLAGGQPVGAIEVECRSRGDARCRFLAGAPERVEAAHLALGRAQDAESVFHA